MIHLTIFLLSLVSFTGANAQSQQKSLAETTHLKLLGVYFTNDLGKVAEIGFTLTPSKTIDEVYFYDPSAKKKENRDKRFPIENLKSNQVLMGDGGFNAALIKFDGSTLTLTYSENALTTDPHLTLRLKIECDSQYNACKVSTPANNKKVTLVRVEPRMKNFVVCSKPIGIDNIYVQ
ncbi:MAG: hypothetical protein JST80_09935 [Bdellovibrionales bacterium]|nr:hypothetical protein [Bdellovibrionales bacterium]